MKTLVVLAALVVSSALALAADSLRSSIVSADRPISKALMHKDIDAFAEAVKPVVTDDFTYSNEGGKPMDFDAMVAGMKQGLAMYTKVTTASTHLISVSQKGDAGKAVERHEMRGYTIGGDKKKHWIVFMGTANETFKKVDGKWKMASMIMKTEKVTMDGKPMPMGGGQ